jgi:hypothetical protein
MTVRPLQSARRFSRNELSGKPGVVQGGLGCQAGGVKVLLRLRDVKARCRSHQAAGASACVTARAYSSLG